MKAIVALLVLAACAEAVYGQTTRATRATPIRPSSVRTTPRRPIPQQVRSLESYTSMNS